MINSSHKVWNIIFHDLWLSYNKIFLYDNAILLRDNYSTNDMHHWFWMRVFLVWCQSYALGSLNFFYKAMPFSVLNISSFHWVDFHSLSSTFTHKWITNLFYLTRTCCSLMHTFIHWVTHLTYSFQNSSQSYAQTILFLFVSLTPHITLIVNNQVEKCEE